MATPYRTSACLAGLPVELLLEIYRNLDLQAVFRFSMTNTEFFQFFQRHKIDILLPILQRDFSPFDEFLQAYTASAGDVVHEGQYKPRMIVFKKYEDDVELHLSRDTQTGASFGHGPQESFQQIRKSFEKPKVSQNTVTTVFLTARDIPGLLQQCRVVREWQELFPQMRWVHQPEDCRLLRPHEQVRFRRALYRWWMYSVHFHGDSPRPRVAHPEPGVDDIRTSQMRYYSTAELMELMDLLETLKDVILQYICPRLDPVRQRYSLRASYSESIGRGHSMFTSWNDESHWGRIVKTYLKLGPEELLYYFNNIYSYTRKRLTTEIQLRHPSFTFDQESIQTAVRCALDERNWIDQSTPLAQHGVGGILDFDDERDGDHIKLQNNGSPDGGLPHGLEFRPLYARHSPRGEDGAFLDDYLASQT
ncbi:hypothetical protein E4U43_005543 [Claviceps pusilla]|uniref:F-box domain-containing protein n=1 Tax=Claviceps pusilla TaxID=123648 RepID=A0A9P7NEE7_9HYPO|nr:hypothetical protein E4U43_005543 [Claviceps pusilla]